MSKTKQQKLFEENYKINRENNCFYRKFRADYTVKELVEKFTREIGGGK